MSESLKEDLRKLIARGEALVVVGAGVSLGATEGASAAGWKGLLLSGVARAEEVGRVSDGWGDRRRGDIESAVASEMISAAEAVTEALGGRRGGEYRRWLEDSVGKLSVASPAVLEALAGLGVPLATTNYDGLLEEVSGRPPVSWREAPLVQKVLRGQKKGIVHLHGFWEQPESVVLGIRSYEDLLRSESSQGLQRAVGTLKSLVFIGCGAGLEDPNFGALLTWLGTHFGDSSYRHFRLCLEAELEELKERHHDSRVMPLAYGARHEDLARFLSRLAPPPTVPAAFPRTSPRVPAKLVPGGAEDPELAAYRRWALEQHGHLHLVGLGAGEVRMSLDEVYVPLRISERLARTESREPHAGKRRGPEALDTVEPRELELEDLFTVVAGPHAASMGFGGSSGSPNEHVVLLGEPGSGKTTGLRKLLYRCLENGPVGLGLDEETVPVLVRLRHLRNEDLAASPGAFLARELAETSGGELAADLGSRLWARGRLLLLLDGLDEIPDTALRAKVCGYLQREFRKAHKREVRAVVSCRKAAYGKIRHGKQVLEVDLGAGFLHAEVRPLDADQCEDLVRRWFHELPRAVPTVPVSEAQATAEGLVAALAGEDFATQRLKVLVGSPLLLTLLCVVVWRGGEMPRHRVAFYGECLRVLLGKWGPTEREQEPALDEVDAALDVLRTLAYELHGEGRQEDLTRGEAQLHIRREIKARGLAANPFRVLEWLHRETGVLTELAPNRFGFMHLGVQEYLSALHIATEGGELVDRLAECAGERWWREVALLAVGLPRTRVFGPLMDKLLGSDALFDQGDLLRDCLQEASEVDREPFLKLLQPGEEPKRQAAVLRLLRGRREPRLLEAVVTLLGSAQRDVALLAEQFVAEAQQEATTDSRKQDLAVICPQELLEPARTLVSDLERQGFEVVGPVIATGLEVEVEELLESVRGVAVAMGAGEEVWELPEVASSLELLTLEGMPLVALRLTGEGRWPALPGALGTVPRFDAGRGVEGDLGASLERVLGRAAAAPAIEAVPGVSEKSFVEPTTGIRFLQVPGGRFQMGGEHEDDGKPIHWVRISPFRLAETPVTNGQYGQFVAATKYQEPDYWRDRRFSDPEQPVVGVSWEDAREFCRWLGGLSGRAITLPSEAQWEFAARSEDGRPFPWGGEPPDASRACFDQEMKEGYPAPVGSFPAGRGPFGHLDLAGNVWEWCLDVWDGEAYGKRQGAEAVDPVVSEGEEDLRVLRGGGWVSPAVILRSAFRYRSHAPGRHADFGFRVAVVPASTVAS